MRFRRQLLVTGTVASATTFILGLVAHRLLPVSANYAPVAAAVMCAITLIAIAFREEHPFREFGAANLVTCVRAIAVSLLAALLCEARAPVLAAIAVACTAGSAVLDGVDGWIARRSRMASAFGARIDMETDALLILVLSALVWRYGKAGAWVLTGGVMRYAFVAAGAMLPWMAAPLTPTLRAKTITIVHVVGLCVALAPIVPRPLSTVAAAVTTTLLGWSFAIDVGRLWRNRPESGFPAP